MIDQVLTHLTRVAAYSKVVGPTPHKPRGSVSSTGSGSSSKLLMPSSYDYSHLSTRSYTAIFEHTYHRVYERTHHLAYEHTQYDRTHHRVYGPK